MVEPRDETDTGAAEPGSVAEALTEYRRKRDFSRTAEPSGPVIDQESASGTRADTTPDTLIGDEALSRAEDPKQAERPVFVMQKHAASSLHYDLRLEMGGVLKSWAVPKGPSLDPADRRLAVLVEDHPLEYATFEGTIPKGEYGGGTVMVWDMGWWEPDLSRIKEGKKTRRAEPPTGQTTEATGLEPEAFDPVASVAAGDLKFIIHGEKLRGSWALVQMKGRGDKNWLLIKHRDDAAQPGTSITAEAPDSVATGRTLEEIAADEGG